jgi:hypothetical protein
MGDRLYKRGSVWWGWCFDADGRRHAFSTRCTDRRAAEAAYREQERRFADPAYAAANAATVESALRRLLVDREQRGGVSEFLCKLTSGGQTSFEQNV